MIVVDASALARLVLMERGHEEVAERVKGSSTVDHAIKEVGNAIWKAYARGYLAKEEATRRFANLTKLAKYVLWLTNEQDVIDDAFKIAIENKITMYDALYIALALREEAELLTADGTQAKAAEKLNVKVIKIP